MAGRITSLLDPSRIVLHVQGAKRTAALNEIARRLDGHPDVANFAGFYDELLAKEPDADVLKSMALQAKNYTNQNRIRTLLAIVRSANANEGVEVAAWNEIKAMRLDPPSQERVSEDFIQAREARPAGRSTAGAQAPSNLPEDRRPPQRPRNIFEQLFGG